MMTKKETEQMLWNSVEDGSLPPNKPEKVIIYNAIDNVTGIFFACDARKYIETWKKDEATIPFDTIDAAKRITHWRMFVPPVIDDETKRKIWKKYKGKCKTCANFVLEGMSNISGSCIEHNEKMSIGGTCKDYERKEDS